MGDLILKPASSGTLILKEEGGDTVATITTGGDVMIGPTDVSGEGSLFVKGTGTTADRVKLENTGGHGKITIKDNSGTETIVFTGSDGKVACSTVDTGQGANELYGMDQDVKTTSAPTFATVNTGQGANELYGMDQDVKTTSAPTFATVNTGQGANELYGMDQDVKTTSSPTFAGGTMNSMELERSFTHPASTTTSSYTLSQGKYCCFVDRINTSGAGFGVFSCNITVASDGTVTLSDETGTSGTMYFSTSSSTFNVIITNTNYIGNVKIIKFGDQ